MSESISDSGYHLPAGVTLRDVYHLKGTFDLVRSVHAAVGVDVGYYYLGPGLVEGIGDATTDT